MRRFLSILALTLPLAAASVRIYQTNSAGDAVDVIDPATNKVVMQIKDIEVPHGVAFSPDGARAYISCEAESTLWAVDTKTGKLIAKAPLTGHPNNIAISKDGRRVFVAIVTQPGAVDVIDTASLTNVKSIPVKGAIHNVYVTPDGKYAVAGSIPASTINVIDTASNTVAWTLTMSAGIRPMAFTRNADGSTREIVVQLSDFHGFAMVDFATRKEVKRVTLPDPKGMEKETQGIQGAPAHGLAITPDGKTLWVTSKYYGYVAAYSLPDCKLLKVVPVGSHPEWLTIPPGGTSLYVALAGNDATVAVDLKTMQVVKKIPVGAVPKRNTSGVLKTE
jgi:YVTN family beta-propeller protein